MSRENCWLQWATERLDDYLRFRDLRRQRTVGGRLSGVGISRHTPSALLLPAVLSALLILGSPSWRRSALATGMLLLMLLVVTAAARWTERRRLHVSVDAALQAAVLVVIAAAIWLLAPRQRIGDGIYAHVLSPLVVFTGTAVLVAAFWVSYQFRRVHASSRYDQYLRTCELFASRETAPNVTVGSALIAFVVAVRSPLALLIVPAITALLGPAVWFKPMALVALGVLLIAFIIAGINERFGAMWSMVLEPFVTGGAALVSGLLIVLGALRYAGVDYVTTVFDTVAWRTIGVVVVSAYLLSWWYDYWADRLVADAVMRMLKKDAGSVARIPYSPDPGYVATRVPATGRVLQIHGAGRFLVLHEEGESPLFQAYTANDLLTLLAISGAPGGKAVPTVLQVRSRIGGFRTVLATLIAVLFVGWVYTIHRGPQLPEAVLATDQAGGLRLSTLLRQTPSATDRPLLVVAASGGGTRAAVYTAAVLEGLAAAGRIQDVVLASGVSGGGAALANFAGHRPALCAENAQPHAWQTYFDTMRQPYIQDVLDHASELRMVSSGRLGILLAESFKGRWALPPERSTVSGIREMGLMLNTSLVGHLELPDDAPKGAIVEVEPAYRAHTKPTLAGGRLVLTNLDLPSGVQQIPLEPGVHTPLPVVVRSDSLRLEEAAALNANFPPVFSNAAIDVTDSASSKRIRYWVTDGGAVDNRGLEMLLFALRLSLEELSTEAPKTPLPRIHLVIIDASAYSDRFGQDRGVGSAFGGGTRFASHLNAELVASIRQRYASQPDRFGYSYVMMPDLFRASGSFGTHWMLQSRIRVRGGDKDAIISGDEMIDVLRTLHGAPPNVSLSTDACRVITWARQDASYVQGWARLQSLFGVPARQPACAAK